ICARKYRKVERRSMHLSTGISTHRAQSPRSNGLEVERHERSWANSDQLGVGDRRQKSGRRPSGVSHGTLPNSGAAPSHWKTSRQCSNFITPICRKGSLNIATRKRGSGNRKHRKELTSC